MITSLALGGGDFNSKMVGKSLHIHYIVVSPKPRFGKGDHFMIRPRDRKCRFIPGRKFPVGIFGSRHTPHINTYDHYT